MHWFLDILALLFTLLTLWALWHVVAALRRHFRWRHVGHAGRGESRAIKPEAVAVVRQRVPHFAAMQEAGADGPADRTFQRIDHGRQVITSDGIRIDGEGLRAAWGYHPIDHPTVHYFDRMNGADGEHWVSRCADVIARVDVNQVRWRGWPEGSPRCSRCYAAVYPGQTAPPQLTN